MGKQEIYLVIAKVMLSSYILQLNGIRSHHRQVDLYLTNPHSDLEALIRRAFQEGVTSFYLEEIGPTFWEITSILGAYSPRSGYTIVTSTSRPTTLGRIQETPIGYYDLVLLRPDVTLNKHTLATAWSQMVTLIATGITKDIGTDNFYTNYNQALFEVILRSSWPLPKFNALILYPEILDQDLIQLMDLFGITIIAKIPSWVMSETRISMLKAIGISSFLMDTLDRIPNKALLEKDNPTKPIFYNLDAEIAFYQDKNLEKTKVSSLDVTFDPEEEI